MGSAAPAANHHDVFPIEAHIMPPSSGVEDIAFEAVATGNVGGPWVWFDKKPNATDDDLCPDNFLLQAHRLPPG